MANAVGRLSASDIGQRIAAVYALKGFLPLVRRQLWRASHVNAAGLARARCCFAADAKALAILIAAMVGF